MLKLAHTPLVPGTGIITAWNGHHYCVERASCPLEFSGGTGILPVRIFRRAKTVW
ncbi:hypothetical protein [Moorena bouillonii]|uniref:hypothetical protein n=1 Tax=Moorena bouillonii TaxID=207920 RepID=UPI0018E92E6C|nr:hypothetical protein [Moorena bouillonii]